MWLHPDDGRRNSQSHKLNADFKEHRKRVCKFFGTFIRLWILTYFRDFHCTEHKSIRNFDQNAFSQLGFTSCLVWNPIRKKLFSTLIINVEVLLWLLIKTSKSVLHFHFWNFKVCVRRTTNSEWTARNVSTEISQR